MMKTRLLILCIVGFTFSAVAQKSWKELSDSLIFYYSKKDFTNALPWAEKATAAVKEQFGAENTIYSSYLTLLAGLYINNQQQSKAIAPLSESLVIYKKNVGEEHKDYIQTLNLLAVTFSNIGQDYKAEPLLVKAVAIYKKKYGNNNADYAASINKLAKVYVEMGQYAKAEPLFIEAVAIRKKVDGEQGADYATTLNNLALLYKSLGNYAKAEPLLLKALTIRKEKFGENSVEYANSINNLASLYEVLGQYKKAKPLYTQAVSLFKNKGGEYSTEYAVSLNNLAQLYQSTGEYGSAIELFQRAITIQKKIFGEEHPAYLNSLNNLAATYQMTDDNIKAEQLYLQAIETEKKVLGEKHPDYVRSLNDLACLYRQEKKYSDAEQLFIKVMGIFKDILGEDHPDYAAVLNNLAVLYQNMGKFDKAETLLAQTKSIETKNLLNVFTVLSEKEKADYITQQSSLNHTANSFLYNYPSATAAFYEANYDLQLLLKGLSLTDTKNVLDAVRNNSDSTISKLFFRWQNNKIILAKQYSLALSNRRDDLQKLEEETEQAEKELSNVSVAFRNQQEATAITWKKVQANLQADEAAIEFVSFNLYNRQWTDTTIYAAYIIRKNDSAPQFVYLTNEQELQRLIDSAGKTATALVKKFYRGFELKNRSNDFLGNRLYQRVWQPIEPFLQGIKKIAYSPAGKLYSIAFNALSTQDSGVLLMDKYELNQYTSTRQVALRSQNNTAMKPVSIVLFGNVSFSMDSLQIIKQRKLIVNDSTISTNIYSSEDRSNRGGVWNNLPGTADEVKKIASFFSNNKVSNKTFTQTSASEDNLKKLSGIAPQILHIATHGFFLPAPDSDKPTGLTRGNVFSMSADPLLRNGIILAGANYAWKGKTPIEGVEDGIATAYEISQLNLSNTELVVLSACETALGDVKGSEGVFGLQRAFKMAGVKKMIVSLWQVPDKETAELMTTFYNYWLKGKTINDAFSQAQADMRKKYAPFYWAAFILVE